MNFAAFAKDKYVFDYLMELSILDYIEKYLIDLRIAYLQMLTNKV